MQRMLTCCSKDRRKTGVQTVPPANLALTAKNTTLMIESTISKIKAGTEMADNVAKSFMSIADGVNEVSNRVGEISSVSY